MKSLKDILWLKEELEKNRDEDQATIKNAIEQRKDIKKYLADVSEALKTCLLHLERNLQHENNVALTELNSSLKLWDKQPSPGDIKKPANSSQLLSLLSEFASTSRDKVMESLKKNNFAEPYQDNVTSAAAQWAEIEKQKSTVFTVKLHASDGKMQHQINPSNLWKGNSAIDLSSNAAPISIAFLISRLAFQPVNEEGAGVIELGFQSLSTLCVPSIICSPPPNDYINSPTFKPMPTADTNSNYSAWGNSETCLAFHSAVISPENSQRNLPFFSALTDKSLLPPPPPNLNNLLIPERRLFIFRVFKSGKAEGEMHIQPPPLSPTPNSSFNSSFMQQLSDSIISKSHCFSITLEKV